MLKPLYQTHKETIHNFLWRGVQTFGKQGITFLIFMLCARLLSVYEFGIYNYALAIIFFLVIFGDFGISTATSKYVAEYNATDKEKLKHILFNSGLIIVGITIIITILAFFIGPVYLKDKYVYVLYLLPLVFLAPMTSLYDGIYCGLKKFRKLALISVVVGLISLSFVYILVKQYGLIGALIAQNLFYILLLIGLFLGYRELHFKYNKELMKKIGMYSLIVGIANFGYYLYTSINSIILGYFGYITQVGYNELINKIFLILIIPFTILGQVMAPDNTALYSKGEFKKIKKSYTKSLIISLAIGIIISIVLYIFLPILLKTFLPRYYNEDLLLMLNVLIFSLPFSIMSGILSSGFIVSTGKAKYSLLTIPFGILNLVLSIVLVYAIGFIGVAISFLISSTLNRILTFSLLYKDINKENEKTSR